MNTYTLSLPNGRISQQIRDVLGLDAAHTHGLWIVSATARNFAIGTLRQRGFPTMTTAQNGVLQHDGKDVELLRAAGFLDEPMALVMPLTGFVCPVAVVERGGEARRVGVLSWEGIGGPTFTPEEANHG
ncbi:hypothetical protein [Verrucosispora sp. NA02020]|uniref:hypothetical protein n=1 Tax=Verrucosispora sp. NA02020 TaxID=2742132 RepID=UPI001591D11B|nr:hypothetical protein [Verrucosispora sp. NA02020]QKW15424.1 hypothetical protein HUT12_23430 [Verrucosispora sp. NA02020]